MCHWIPDLNLKKRFGYRVHFIKLFWNTWSANHTFSHTKQQQQQQQTHSLWSSSHACHVGKAHCLRRVRPYKRRMGDLDYEKKKGARKYSRRGQYFFRLPRRRFWVFVRRFTRQNVLTYLVGSEAEARQRQRIGMEIVGKHRDR